MKRITFFLISLLFLAACSAPGPKATVERAFESIKNQDAKAYIKFLPANELAELEAIITDMKETPEYSADFLTYIGLSVTVEEIKNLTVESYLTLQLKSLSEAISSAEVSYGNETINGDEATVQLIINGTTGDVDLIKENGKWVIIKGLDLN